MAWPVFKASSSEIMFCSWCLGDFWEPVSHLELPSQAFMQGEVLGPTSVGGVDGKKVERNQRREWEKMGEEKLWLLCKINFKNVK